MDAPHLALGFGQRLAFLARHVGGDLVELAVQDVGGLERMLPRAGPLMPAQPGSAAAAACRGIRDVRAVPFTNSPTTSSVLAGLRFSNVARRSTHSPLM